MGSSSGKSSTTTIQQADPWKGQQPYLTDIFRQASGQYYGQAPQYYPGSTTRDFTPEELAAQARISSYAQSGAQGLANEGMAAQQFMLGDVLRADSNPYMAEYAQGAIRPVFEQLTRTALPAVDSGAIAAGGYGGSRQGIAQGLAMSDATRQALDTTSKMYSGMYDTNLGAMQKAIAMNPQVMQAGMLPGQMLAGVGADKRALEQAKLDDAVARWEWEQSLPATRLAQYMSMVQGNYGGQSSSTTSGQTPQPSTAQKIVGAGLTGLSVYGAATGSLGATLGISAVAAPWLAGAVALGSLFL